MRLDLFILNKFSDNSDAQPGVGATVDLHRHSHILKGLCGPFPTSLLHFLVTTSTSSHWLTSALSQM